MSDTPRTDDITPQVFSEETAERDRNNYRALCMELERENAQLRAALGKGRDERQPR